MGVSNIDTLNVDVAIILLYSTITAERNSTTPGVPVRDTDCTFDFGRGRHAEDGVHRHPRKQSAFNRLPLCSGESLRCFNDVFSGLGKNKSVNFLEGRANCLPPCADEQYSVGACNQSYTHVQRNEAILFVSQIKVRESRMGGNSSIFRSERIFCQVLSKLRYICTSEEEADGRRKSFNEWASLHLEEFPTEFTEEGLCHFLFEV